MTTEKEKNMGESRLEETKGMFSGVSCFQITSNLVDFNKDTNDEDGDAEVDCRSEHDSRRFKLLHFSYHSQFYFYSFSNPTCNFLSPYNIFSHYHVPHAWHKTLCFSSSHHHQSPSDTTSVLKHLDQPVHSISFAVEVEYTFCERKYNRRKEKLIIVTSEANLPY